MIKVRIITILITLGGIIISLGGGLLAMESVFEFQGFGLLGSFLLGMGVILVLVGCFEVIPKCKIISEWDNNLLERTLKFAPQKSKIRILQTWFPDYQRLCPFLERLLIDNGKQFSFEILLMDPGEADSNDDLLAARILHRLEDRRHAREQIHATIKRLLGMKQRVDDNWGKRYKGTKLDIDIRLYKFMPFGPIYQIGEKCLFVGFYPNYDSSVIAPMLVIRDANLKIWIRFEDNFKTGWKYAMKVNELKNGKIFYDNNHKNQINEI
ncbi:MAG: hypothetical protein WBD28_12620 [Candidatus Zixiibacteriota bacterium]